MLRRSRSGLFIRICFNGTTFFQTWKSRRRFDSPSLSFQASMEPRFFKRGNNSIPKLLRVEFFCFNGTTFFQTWKSHLWKSISYSSAQRFNGTTFFQTWKCANWRKRDGSDKRFNGTTFFQTWKSRTVRTGGRYSPPLQWNHVFSNVEIVEARFGDFRSRHASMEPRFFKRGNSLLHNSRLNKFICFNGTTFFQTWKCLLGVRQNLNWVLCFNGTTFFQTWKFVKRKTGGKRQGKLQWNHVFSNVEIRN